MLAAGLRPILTVHGSSHLQKAIARILPATLRPIHTASNTAEAWAALAHSPEVVIVDQRTAVEADGAFLTAAGQAGVIACIILLDDTDPLPLVELPTTIPTIALSNLVDPEGPVLADELVVSVLKLLRRDVFGMEKYLSWRVVPVTRTLTHSSDRQSVVDELREHIAAQGYHHRLHWLAAQAADELLSNAIFHGPVSDTGEHLRSATSRSEEFPLVGREQVRFRYGSDGRYFCLEVRDQYGSLTRETLVHCLRRRPRTDLSPNLTDTPGAGIGLSLTAGYVSHLVCNLEPGERTELIALFDLRPRARIHETGPASFNAFVAKPALSAIGNRR